MNDLSILVLGTLTLLMTVLTLILLVYLFQRRLYRQQMEFQQVEKLLRIEELRSAYAFIEGREEERKRIAQDLHDNLGSQLATIRLYLEQIEQLNDHNVQSKGVFEKAFQVLTQTSEQTRRLSHELGLVNPSSFSLFTSLTSLCEAIRDSGKLAVETYLDLSAPLDSQVSLHLYRLVQELFSNTLKHAGASKVRLEVSQFPGQYLSLIYEDNGKGFDPAQVSEGMGMKNIQSRVQLLNGFFSIDSQVDRGVTFTLEIPLEYGNAFFDMASADSR